MNAVNVMNCLLRGKQNARSREYLRTLTGLNDRALRHEIEEIRNAGIIVCNDGDGKGYYISEDIADMRRQYKRDTAMIAAIAKRRKYIRAALIERGEDV